MNYWWWIAAGNELHFVARWGNLLLVSQVHFHDKERILHTIRIKVWKVRVGGLEIIKLDHSLIHDFLIKQILLYTWWGFKETIHFTFLNPSASDRSCATLMKIPTTIVKQFTIHTEKFMFCCLLQSLQNSICTTTNEGDPFPQGSQHFQSELKYCPSKRNVEFHCSTLKHLHFNGPIKGAAFPAVLSLY